MQQAGRVPISWMRKARLGEGRRGTSHGRGGPVSGFELSTLASKDQVGKRGKTRPWQPLGVPDPSLSPENPRNPCIRGSFPIAMINWAMGARTGGLQEPVWDLNVQVQEGSAGRGRRTFTDKPIIPQLPDFSHRLGCGARSSFSTAQHD